MIPERGPRRRFRIGVAVVVAIFMLGAHDRDAEGHQVSVCHGQDCAYTFAEHEGLQVCDQERDGRRAYAQGRTASSLYGVSTQGAGDCGSTRTLGGKLQSIRVCEPRSGTDSCTAWRAVS